MSHPGAVTGMGCDICGRGDCTGHAWTHPFFKRSKRVQAITYPSPRRIIDHDGFLVAAEGAPLTVDQALEYGVIDEAPSPATVPTAVERIVDENGFLLYPEGAVMTAEHAEQFGSSMDETPRTKRANSSKGNTAKKPAGDTAKKAPAN